MENIFQISTIEKISTEYRSKSAYSESIKKINLLRYKFRRVTTYSDKIKGKFHKSWYV